jgi:hypothetical protein
MGVIKRDELRDARNLSRMITLITIHSTDFSLGISNSTTNHDTLSILSSMAAPGQPSLRLFPESTVPFAAFQLHPTSLETRLLRTDWLPWLTVLRVRRRDASKIQRLKTTNLRLSPNSLILQSIPGQSPAISITVSANSGL